MKRTKRGLNHLLLKSLSIGRPLFFLFRRAGRVYAPFPEGVLQKGYLLGQHLVLLVEYGDDHREVEVYEKDEYECHEEEKRRRIGDADVARDSVEDLFFKGEDGDEKGAGEPEDREIFLEEARPDE